MTTLQPWNPKAQWTQLLMTRRTTLWCVFVAAISVFLAFVPGFDALAYFFCLVTAPVLAIGSGHLAIEHTQRARGSLHSNPELQWRLLTHSLACNLTLSLVPLTIITTNLVRIKVCDYGSGLLFYGIGPILSASYGTALGHSLGLVVHNRTKAMSVFVGVMLVSFSLLLSHFYYHPTIFAYSPYIGFISGAIYDDVIQIGATFLIYRLNNLCQAATVVIGATILFRHRTVQPTRASQRSPWALFAICITTTLVFYCYRGTIGYEITRNHIEAELGGVYETEHFVLHYPRHNSWFRQNIAQIAQDHEFRYSQLTTELGTVVSPRIRSYLYADNSQKRRLMGADKVQIAKPWLGEIHLSRPEHGAEVIKHEIAHLFAANFAPGPLRIPAMLGVLPHMGLVEGLAVAVESSRGRLSIHQWSAALLALNKLPDLTQVLGPAGYFSTYGATAYTTAGSFLRYLIDSFGLPKVQQVYADGDFERTFGQPLSTLVTDWKAWLADPTRVPVSSDDLERARFIYDRKPMLGTVCPLVVARLEREADRSRKKGDYDHALLQWKQVESHNPRNPEKRFPQIDLLIRLNRPAEARTIAQSIMTDPQTSVILRVRTELALADITWLEGSPTQALNTYQALLAAPLSEDELRTIDVRYHALSSGVSTIANGVRDYLVARSPAAQARFGLLAALNQTPNHPLLTYLTGRYLFSERRYLASAAILSTIGDHPAITTRVRREIEKSLGEAWYFLGVYDVAITHFRRAATYTPKLAQGMLATLADWEARCRWMAKRPRSLDLTPHPN